MSGRMHDRHAYTPGFKNITVFKEFQFFNVTYVKSVKFMYHDGRRERRVTTDVVNMAVGIEDGYNVYFVFLYKSGYPVVGTARIYQKTLSRTCSLINEITIRP